MNRFEQYVDYDGHQVPEWLYDACDGRIDDSMLNELEHGERSVLPPKDMALFVEQEANSTYLKHYGTKRHSGRYPYGSGEDPYQHEVSFLSHVHEMRKQGYKDTEIAKSMEMNTAQLRARISMAESTKREYERTEAMRLRDKGVSVSAIARRMGRNESSIRSLLDETKAERANRNRQAADMLKEIVDEKGYVDVSAGTEHYIPNFTQDRMKKTLALLELEGYPTHSVKFEQLGTGNSTTMAVLCKPGTTWKDAQQHKGDVKLLADLYSEDGQTLTKIAPPQNVKSSRIFVFYNEDGGVERDGCIWLRRGVDDISLGNAQYAQVRIAVDGTHYAKGMAMHKDDAFLKKMGVPDDCDIIINSKKHVGTPLKGDDNEYSVLKKMKGDPTNPFGATIKVFDNDLTLAQRHYIGADGKEHQSALNIVSEEGDWSKWSKNLASEFAAKQSPAMVKKQLNIAYQNSKAEFDDICKLTNPVIRNALLEKFASQCDSDATHMKAAALPRQATKVLLPFQSLKPNEIYAPHLEDGEEVYLVRYPHGGIFEIPKLVVNNHNREAINSIGKDPRDCVGLNAEAAKHLSGADFDGDTAVIIPAASAKIKNAPYPESLQDFDPGEMYAEHEGMRRMKKSETGLEMGKITNLITDMTIKGASMEEIVRATKHSMVVIDAEKHHLDYLQSFEDNGIAELQEKYQKAGGGSSTLLSKATSPVYWKDFKEKPYYKMTDDEKKRWENGEVIYTETGKQRKKAIKDSEGNIVEWTTADKMTEISRMQTVSDAYELTSKDANGKPKPIEVVYAEYANSMKELARQARAISRRDEEIPYEPSAAKAYRAEVDSLNAKIRQSEMEAPLERQAQLIANRVIKQRLADNPEMRDDRDKVKKMKGQELSNARHIVRMQPDGTERKKFNFWITDREWQAISAGAVSKTTLRKIMRYSDMDRLRSLATPRSGKVLSAGKLTMARTRLNAGYTRKEVAEMLGVSVSTLDKALDKKAD